MKTVRIRKAVLMRVLVYGAALLIAFVIVRHPDAILRTFGLGGARSVSAVVSANKHRVEAKYRPIAQALGSTWPPAHVQLLAFKTERVLEVWAGPRTGELVRIATFPIEAASGGLGPKAREGDKQVPEGVYGLPRLNPNSQFHLSLFVDYPNSDDVARSKIPVEKMGGEIFVHGGAASIGCIAIGDAAIDDVFTIAAQVDDDDRGIIIAPYDFRRPPNPPPDLPADEALYARLRSALNEYPPDGRQR